MKKTTEDVEKKIIYPISTLASLDNVTRYENQFMQTVVSPLTLMDKWQGF